MENETNIERIKYDQELLNNRIAKHKKICNVFYIILSAFCCICIAYLIMAWLFSGVFSVFGVTFSFPNICMWLENLPYASTKYPTTQLIRLFIGIAFFIAYIIGTIMLIIYLIKSIKGFISITDIKNTRINHRAIAYDVLCFTIKSFRVVLSITLLSFLTLPKEFNLISIITLAVYVLFYLFTNVVLYLYAYYDVNKGQFNKKGFTVSVVKSSLIIAISLALVFLTANGQIYEAMENLRIVLYVNKDIPTVKLIEMFYLPITSGWLYYKTTRLLRNVIKYQNNYIFDEYSISYYANKLSIKIMVYASIYYTAIFLFNFFDVEGHFFIPSNQELLSMLIALLLPLTPIVLLSIAIKYISLIKEHYKTKL